MKRIACEMCRSVDVVKEDGFYVCQNCGTKYTIEEAKKLIVEGKVKIDKSDDASNYLELAESALESGNGVQAYNYAIAALEITPKSHKAWLLKMKSIEYIATVGNLMLKEVVTAGANAIKFAKDEKEEIEKEVYNYYLIRAMDLFRLTMEFFNNVKDLKTQLAVLLVASPVTAHVTLNQQDSKLRELYVNIETEAYELTKYVPVEFLEKNADTAKLLLECVKQYRYSSDAFNNRLKVFALTLQYEAVNYRNNVISEMYYRGANALSKLNITTYDIDSVLMTAQKQVSAKYIPVCIAIIVISVIIIIGLIFVLMSL